MEEKINSILKVYCQDGKKEAYTSTDGHLWYRQFPVQQKN